MQAYGNTPDRPQRLVLDTNAWLDLLYFDDPRLAPLHDLAANHQVLLLTDEGTRAEWRRVLAYPQLALNDATQCALLAAYDALACPLSETDATPDVLPVLPRCRDRDDQIFIELAAASAATVLLTRDKALLALDRRCRRVAGFAVCQPAEWLADRADVDAAAPAGAV